MLKSRRVRGTLRLMFRKTFSHAFLTLYQVNLDSMRFLGSLLQSRSALAAENLFLRKQLALYQERQVRPRRATDATRLTMVLASRLFDWKDALISVRPETFTRWHRQGFKIVLAVEIRTQRQTQDCQKSSSTHPGHGPGQSYLGASPYRSGAPIEAGNSGVPSDCSEVSAGGSEGRPTPDSSIPTLDDFRPQSCQRNNSL